MPPMPGRCRRAVSIRARMPWPAALRELREETNITTVERLGEIPEWLSYDIPRDIVGLAWKGKYRGQRQKWFALRFTGEESEIDVANPAGTHEPEFAAWRWEPMQNIPNLVVPFKRAVYERVVGEFSHLAEAIVNSARPQTGRCAITWQALSCLAQSAMAPADRVLLASPPRA